MAEKTNGSPIVVFEGAFKGHPHHEVGSFGEGGTEPDTNVCVFEFTPDEVQQIRQALIKGWNYTAMKDRRGKDITVGQVVHWSDGGEDLDMMERIKTRWDRIAVVEKDPDIAFRVIDSPSEYTVRNCGIFHYGNFIYRDTHNYLTVVAESEDEYRKKFANAAECMIWVARP